MKEQFKPGLAIKREILVTDHMLCWLDGRLIFPVISTVSVAGVMECTGRRLIEPHLDEDEDALGVELSVEHLATCGSGKRLTVTAELDEYRHQRIRISYALFDGDRVIATGVQSLQVLPKTEVQAAIAEGQTDT